MQIVIPSRKRVKSCRHALRIFPSATVCIDEAEQDDYAPMCEKVGAPIVTHPSSVAGIGPLKQWILDNFEDEVVVIAADDVHEVRLLAGRTSHSAMLRDTESVMQILQNAEICARGLGTPIFGFSQNGGDVRKFRPFDPFVLPTWVGGVMGIIGREYRYDTTLLLRADIDFCLQVLLKHRVIFMDNRFAFVHARFNNAGGNSHMRTGERNRQELEYLKRKWGHWLKYSQGKEVLRLLIRSVVRRQNIKL